ncbi:MAG: AAA family ATPase [Candidatus Methanomethylophilaceae archaeon]|nr:AAA family ATPase [Candidatus Methanomethylophilaceae archaeon]
MDSTTIRAIAIKSCEDMFEQMTAVQKGASPKDSKIASMAVNEIRHINRKPNFLKITLSTRISGDIEQTGIFIEGEGSFFKEATFDDYDETSLTVTMYPSENLRRIIDNHPDRDIKIVSDMKWLIKLTMDFFVEHGEDIGYPKNTPHFEEGDYSFPVGEEPTKEQKKAVKTILNSSLSYIWGAPGTGKTQFVMATAILAHIRKGGRVAIIAPTNNAVEQVLRGVLKVVEKDDPVHELIVPEEDIIRLGAATSEFIHDYKEICEDRAVMSRIRSLQTSNEIIANVIYERGIEILKSHFDELDVIYSEEYDRADPQHRAMMDETIARIWSEISSIVSIKPEFSGLVEGIDEYNLRNQYKVIAKRLMERDRSVLDIIQYRDLSNDELLELINRNLEEIRKLEPRSTAHRVKSSKIMAMTPYILMGNPHLFETGGIRDVNQIFIDEVGYSNLIQTMPVFMCGPPIAMLGDHMQLPPVCELNPDDIVAWCTEDDDYRTDGFMRYSFMWNQSALNIEQYLFGTDKDVLKNYLDNSPPRFKNTRRVNLTLSHRFADNLARILDECVYHNGVRGHGGDPLKVVCYDAIGAGQDSRENKEEAEMISDYLDNNRDEIGSYTLLTPYRDQRKKLKYLSKKDSDKILTVHGSQGREWDTVILSVVDNRNSCRQIPLRFTSSISPNEGMRVINTAVSRAKRRLIIFCDAEFWKGRAKMNDLLGRIIADPDTEII